MDPELKLRKTFSENTDREKVKFKKQLLIYLFFLFIAVVFWYLNALGKIYSTHLHFSVYYKDYPKGKVLISDNNTNVDVQVTGIGYHLLRLKILSLFRNININLKDYSSQIKSSGQFKYVLAANAVQSKFEFLFNTVQVNSIKPDSLYFLFTEVIDKKIAIKPILNLEFEQPFMQKGNYKVVPDCLVISGPRALIDTLKWITTKPLVISGINKSITAEAELNPLKHFIYPQQSIKIVIPAEKFTEVVYNIPIESENTPVEYTIRTFPATINLSFNVAVSDFDKMNPNMFRAVVDYNAIPENHPPKLKVTLVKIPLEAKNIKFNPKSVDYLIE